MVSPYFFLEKTDDLFSHRPLESDVLSRAVIVVQTNPALIVRITIFFISYLLTGANSP